MLFVGLREHHLNIKVHMDGSDVQYMYSVCMRLRCLHPLARAVVLKAYMYRFQLLFFFPCFYFKS